ncbi:MAG TPA: response regulator transcription factor [Actinoplanes sp.]|nr:response regulator transcription factor [Actinoplanes sp.]
MARILVAEDEQRISSFIERGLRASGFIVTSVSDGPAAIDHALTGDHDLLLLDLGLPLLDGFAVLNRLRQAGSRIPVIILTARSGINDTVAGLQGGADDYIAKPFRFDELVARIQLRLRSEHRPSDAAVLRYGDLALDAGTRRAAVDGRQIDLSAREYHLLQTLIQHPGQVLSREQLLSQVWGYDFDPGSNIVDVYIRYLRRKLGAERIETVRGLGYRLTEGRSTGDR